MKNSKKIFLYKLQVSSPCLNLMRKTCVEAYWDELWSGIRWGDWFSQKIFLDRWPTTYYMKKGFCHTLTTLQYLPIWENTIIMLGTKTCSDRQYHSQKFAVSIVYEIQIAPYYSQKFSKSWLLAFENWNF